VLDSSVCVIHPYSPRVNSWLRSSDIGLIPPRSLRPYWLWTLDPTPNKKNRSGTTSYRLPTQVPHAGPDREPWLLAHHGDVHPVFVGDVLAVVVIAEIDADPLDVAGERAVFGSVPGETGDAASLPTSAVSSMENMNGRVRSMWPWPI
jgi:hypothetical protein